MSSLGIEKPQQGAVFDGFAAMVAPTLTHLDTGFWGDVGDIGPRAASLRRLTSLQHLHVKFVAPPVAHQPHTLLPAVLPALTQLTRLAVSLLHEDPAAFEPAPCPGSLRELKSMLELPQAATSWAGLVHSAGSLPGLARLELEEG